MTNALLFIIIQIAVQNSRWETSIVKGSMPHFQYLVVLLLVLYSAPKMAADF